MNSANLIRALGILIAVMAALGAPAHAKKDDDSPKDRKSVELALAVQEKERDCVPYDPNRPMPKVWNRNSFTEYMLPMAVLFQQHTGYPAAVLIAQAGAESGWGTARAGKNNIYGIRCSKGVHFSFHLPAGAAESRVSSCSSWSDFESLDKALIANGGLLLMHPGVVGVVDLNVSYGGIRKLMWEMLRTKYGAHFPPEAKKWGSADLEKVYKVLAEKKVAIRYVLPYQDVLKNMEGYDNSNGYGKRIEGMIEESAKFKQILINLKKLDKLTICESQNRSNWLVKPPGPAETKSPAPAEPATKRTQMQGT